MIPPGKKAPFKTRTLSGNKSGIFCLFGAVTESRPHCGQPTLDQIFLVMLRISCSKKWVFFPFWVHGDLPRKNSMNSWIFTIFNSIVLLFSFLKKINFIRSEFIIAKAISITIINPPSWKLWRNNEKVFPVVLFRFSVWYLRHLTRNLEWLFKLDWICALYLFSGKWLLFFFNRYKCRLCIFWPTYIQNSKSKISPWCPVCNYHRPGNKSSQAEKHWRMSEL